MDRPRHAATKITDYRKYHLSGDLADTLQGRVDSQITQFEMSAEELKAQLESEKETVKGYKKKQKL